MTLLDVRLGSTPEDPEVLALVVHAPGGAAGREPDDTADTAGPAGGGDDDPGARIGYSAAELSPDLTTALEAFLPDLRHPAKAGKVHTLPRPGQQPQRVVLVGVGDGGDGDWRAAGAGLVRGVARSALTIAVPADTPEASVGALIEGALLASYRYRLVPEPDDAAPRPTELTIAVADPDRYAGALDRARIRAEVTCIARDLTNTPAADKSPGVLAEQVCALAEADRIGVQVREPEQLARDGFGGIVAVGGGSARGPRLVELRWQPESATRHVVLVGKGITFDTGGLCIKKRDGMLLMRKDMGGAASVAATVIGAARLNLPVRVTALLPLADNMVSGDAYRPGDVVRHYGGITSEVHNTDAEGRMVLADALAYAAAHLEPDVLVDVATLTGAVKVSLGKRTAALLSQNDTLADQFRRAAEAAGERVWRMPLADDYRELLDSDIADLTNVPPTGNASTLLAALFLREFTGDYTDRWVHLDMSAPAWSDKTDRELTKGATGWGVRTLLNWLETVPA